MSSPSERGVSVWTLLGETIRMAASQRVASVMVGLIVAAVCGVILTTTGRTIQAEAAVLSKIDDAGTRSIIITDTNGNAGLRAAAVARVSQLSSVEWVLGLGPAHDVHNSAIGAGGAPIAARALHGHIPPAVLTTGRSPGVGEALVGTEAQQVLGLQLPAGGVRNAEDATTAIVGGFTATEPLTFLNTSVLIVANSDVDEALRSIHVLAANPEDVNALTRAVLGIVDPDDPTALAVATSETIAEVRAAVAGELGQYSRTLALTILGAGLVLVALTVYGAVTLRRQDFGRRRALGATRMNIVLLVLMQHLVIGIGGAVAGAATGSALIWRWTAAPPQLAFVTAIAVLAVLASLAAALPPALIAAWRDPVRVLRVP